MVEKKKKRAVRQVGEAVSSTTHFSGPVLPKKRTRIVTVRRCEVCEGHGNIDGFSCRLCGGVGQHILTPVKEASK